MTPEYLRKEAADAKDIGEKMFAALLNDAADTIERLRGTLQSVLGQLEEGFSVCEQCQHQEDTKEMDVVYELRSALKPQ